MVLGLGHVLVPGMYSYLPAQTRMTDTAPAYRSGHSYRRVTAPLALRKAPVPVPYRYLYCNSRYRPHCKTVPYLLCL